MATLGTREMSKKSSSKPSEAISIGVSGTPVNLTVGPVKVQPVSTVGFQPTSVGSPIMREDFITTTGLMVSKDEL